MKITRYEDIPKFLFNGNYAVNVPWKYLQENIDRYAKYSPLELDPDFQRGHVWTDEKRTAYIEYCLMGGTESRRIFWNNAGFMSSRNNGIGQPFILVDGKQRLTAVQLFLDNKVKAFGSYFNEFETTSFILGQDLIFCVNCLMTRKEVLTWYLQINSGGVVHTQEELDKVRKLLELEEN